MLCDLLEQVVNYIHQVNQKKITANVTEEVSKKKNELHTFRVDTVAERTGTEAQGE